MYGRLLVFCDYLSFLSSPFSDAKFFCKVSHGRNSLLMSPESWLLVGRGLELGHSFGAASCV